MLSPEVHARGIYPPVDLLASLSRLMRNGRARAAPSGPPRPGRSAAGGARAGPAGPRAGRGSSGESALSVTDQRYLEFAATLERGVLAQRRHEQRRDGPDPRPVLGGGERAPSPRADHAASTGPRRPPRAEGMTSCPASPRCPRVAPDALAAPAAGHGRARPRADGPASCASCSPSSNGGTSRPTGGARSGYRPAPRPTVAGRAVLLGGQDALRQASTTRPTSVEVEWSTAMGLSYPSGAELSLPRTAWRYQR